jgi:hypothetical protein
MRQEFDLRTTLRRALPAVAARTTTVLATTVSWVVLAWVALAHGAEPMADSSGDTLAGDTAPVKIDYARDVVPILASSCYLCHGPDEQESGFRLDIRSQVFAGGDFGEPAIVAGASDESPLVEFISNPDAEVRMPPEGPRLPPAEVDTIRRWIDAGAEWPDELAGDADAAPTTDHWSFQPLERPEVPDVDDPRVANPIDAFILARLTDAGLAWSPPAGRATLIRRLLLDVHGLPPQPEEIKGFVADVASDAYARLVERVLASHRYGERWARHWLDVVRFAETNGFETNTPRDRAWPYRDYVIAALDDDRPYDRFIIEQLAGDTCGADVATGFLVGGPTDMVKSPDVVLTSMQRQDELTDMVNTTGTALLGLTLGCAKCHAHKFDPITQNDFYSMQAMLAGVTHGERAVRDEAYVAREKELAALEATIGQLAEQLQPYRQPLREAVAAAGNDERFAAVTARWVRFTVLATNSSEPCIDELEIFAAGEGDEDDDAAVNVSLAANGAIAMSSGDYEGSPLHKLAHINDGEYGNSRSWIANTVGGGWVQIELAQDERIDRIAWARDREGRYVDRLATEYRIEVASEPDVWKVVASHENRLPAGATSPTAAFDITQLAGDARTRAEAWLSAYQTAVARRDELESAATTMVYAGVFIQPGPTHRLHRGDPMQKREEVSPATPRVLDAVVGATLLDVDAPEPQRRRALAQWITSPANPLTARVLVNRIWQHHFGTGIVDTPSDFGAMGTAPSHPELLDWLASEFIESGWSMKHIHRLILMSGTYQQASTLRPEAVAIDVGSRLLWRYPSRRLEAEPIRDSILAVSGAIDLTMGGPGYSAFEPNENYVRVYEPREEFGPVEWRRMIYMTKVRMEQDSVFGAFDCPDAGQVCPKRAQSTTALQALNLQYSEFLLDEAQRFNERVSADVGGVDDPTALAAARVDRACWLALGREPDDVEREAAVKLVSAHGLPAFCRALFNANEFLFIP